MEITKGTLCKYDVATVVIRPPLNQNDIMDMELLLVSKDLPGLIKGYLTIDKCNNYNPRSYTNGQVTLSQASKRDLRVAMKQLAVQLRGELDDA